MHFEFVRLLLYNDEIMGGIFKVDNYSLKKTLESGQVFRWKCRAIGEYIGVVRDSVVVLKQFDGGIRYQIIEGSVTRDELEHYLALDEDYDEILRSVSQDDYVRDALSKYQGYRILRQEPGETLISFIDSANNSVGNIRAQMDNLSRMFGEQIFKNFYTFPEIGTLAELTEEQIKEAKVGFRGKYMIRSAKMLMQDNILETLSQKDSDEAHENLKGLPGVGDKIADCVLLFALNRLERVPIDVWTKRILKKLYSFDPSDKYQVLQDRIYSLHEDFAGYAFSFLFEAARLGDLECSD